MINLDEDTLIQVLSWTDNAGIRNLIVTNQALSTFVRTHRMEICRLKLHHLGKDFKNFTDDDPCYVYQYRNHFSNPNRLLLHSIKNNDTRLINLSIDLNANLSTYGTYALLIASMNEREDIVNRLIQKGVPSDNNAILKVFQQVDNTQVLEPSMVSEQFGISALTLKLLQPGLTVEFIRNVPVSAFSLKTPVLTWDENDEEDLETVFMSNDKTPLMLALKSMYAGNNEIMRAIIGKTPENAFLIQNSGGSTVLGNVLFNEDHLNSNTQLAIIIKAPTSCFLLQDSGHNLPIHTAIYSLMDGLIPVNVLKVVINKTPTEGFHMMNEDGQTPLQLATQSHLPAQLRQLIAAKTV